MDHVQLVGYIATAILGAAFIPQTIQVWRTKSVADISLVTFSMLTFATLLWIYYAYSNKDTPLLLVNILLFINQGSILLCKLLYGKSKVSS